MAVTSVTQTQARYASTSRLSMVPTAMLIRSTRESRWVMKLADADRWCMWVSFAVLHVANSI